MRLPFCLACIFLFFALRSSVEGIERRTFTFEEMMKIQRVSDPQLSPDGKRIAFTVTASNLEKNSLNSDIWLMPAAGGRLQQMTQSPKNDERPRWAPDSRSIAFVSNRSGQSRLWILPVDAGEAMPVDTHGLEASGVLWSPDGRYLAFISEVYPDCQEIDCNMKRDQQKNESLVKARILDRLLFRHWDQWKDGKRSHLFLVPANGGMPRDLTPGDYDVPPFSLDGSDDYVFSPDGREICFVKNGDENEAITTNQDLFIVSVEGREDGKRITVNPGSDRSPRYSPDGRFIGYRSQKRAGYEADRWRLTLYDREKGVTTTLGEDLDRSVESFTWHPDSKSIFMSVGDHGLHVIYRLDIRSSSIRSIIDSHSNDNLQVSKDGEGLVFLRQSFTNPAEIYASDSDGKYLKRLTAINQPLLSELDLVEPETIWFEGAGKKKVQAWIIKPPGFNAKKKYPLLMLIHGGPQGVWGDLFFYRWNGNVFASHGYVVLMPNPRGSTTFGQDFTDEIRNDWGGKVYEDLMKAVDHMLTLGYVDPNHLAAAGGSFGGYMANWIAGHTDRFKCLVSHAGTYNLTSDYGVTEELWFPEWEFMGTPWTNREAYDKWSPDRFVRNFRTPMLVIHGELDFRVPVGEAFQLFTALQREKIPSKMLYFPDEGHWILKPKNSQLWYETFIEWLDTYLK